MTAFVESCVVTAAGSAAAAARKSRGRPRAAKLLSLLANKKNILVTTHLHPDPDALASGVAMMTLLSQKLPEATVSMSVKGQMAGGINDAFVRYTDMKLVPWDEATLPNYDAIILVDTQPAFAYSPLPAGVMPMVVVDHHRGRGRQTKVPFNDIRPEVGAAGSIVFSYFMELEVPIKPDLAATLLYGIESDLAGAAGSPGELDNIALSSLTLIADPRKLYRMRYVDLPRSYYIAYASALSNAVVYDNVLISHLDSIGSLEIPAVLADFLLRLDKVDATMVTAVHDSRLIVSLRTNNAKLSAADVARRLVRNLGVGGGHRAKAGGYINLETGSPAEVEKIRGLLRKRFLRLQHISSNRGQRLVPRPDAPERRSTPTTKPE
jgi:nanoRNase/pAp phosphatase (c-di-AMP/oligoRNAs hydrolase)